MHRGARRAPIFRSDDHCALFLSCLEEAVEHHGLELHAYALMPNHYHLLVRSRLGNLSRCMQHVNGTYTQRLNRGHGWDGPVFRGRFRSQVVDDDRYLDHVFAYIHLNPFSAGLARRLDDPCWTSLRAYLGKERAPTWLRTDVFTERFGGRAGIEGAIRERRKRPEGWPTEMDREDGWLRSGDLSPRDSGRVRAPVARTAAPRSDISEVLAQVAAVAGCSVPRLRVREMGPGANPARRLAVWALSREQRFPHAEIASALKMSTGQVAKVLWRLRAEPARPPLSDWMAALLGRQAECGRV